MTFDGACRLNDSTKALSVGLPALLKPNVTRLMYAQWSSAQEIKSGPLSTRILVGEDPRSNNMRSSTSTTCSPVNFDFFRQNLRFASASTLPDFSHSQWRHFPGRGHGPRSVPCRLSRLQSLKYLFES